MLRSRPCSTRLVVLGSMILGLALAPALTAAQSAPTGDRVPPEALGPLLRAAADSSGATLAPWQRDFMRELATSGVGAAEALTANAADGNWTPLPAGAGSQGPGRFYHSAIYDPVKHRMVLLGGWDGTFRNDVWQLTLSGTSTWTQLAPSGTPPSGRYGFTAIYDPVRQRMIVFGGLDNSAVRNDTWALSL